MSAWLIAATSATQALLGSNLLIAAASKPRDARAFQAALDALGIARTAHRTALAAGVPIAEAALGLWLWSGWRPVWSAAAAAVLFALLTVVLLRLRWRGYTGACGCFIGERAGIGPLTFVRNIVLFTLAAGLAWTAARVPIAHGSAPDARTIRLLVILIVAAALGGYAIRPRRMIASRAHGADAADTADAARTALPALEVTPGMEWTDLTGARITLGRPSCDAQLIVFAKGRCPGCLRDRDLLNRLPLQPPRLETVFVCGGNLEETIAFASEVRSPVRVVADPTWQTAVAWQVSTTPFSILVDQRGQIRSRGPLTAALARLPQDDTSFGAPAHPHDSPA